MSVDRCRRRSGRAVVWLFTVLATAFLLLVLSPSAAFADCGKVSYQEGGDSGDCSPTAPIIGIAAVGGAAAVTAVALSVLSYLRGRMSKAELDAILAAYTAPPGIGTARTAPWSRPATGTVGGSPTGPRTTINPRQDEDVKRSLQRENDCANILARAGYRVHQNPTQAQVANARAQTGDTGDPDKNPDYLIEGHVFDCYSPRQGRSVRNVWSEVRDKIDDRQTQRVVLNLHDWGGDLGALQRQFDDWPIDRLKEVVAVTSAGTILQIVVPG
jgi:hypothetical protein